MVEGPRALGLDLHSPEARHDRLRGLWAQHEDAIVAEAERRGIETTWYESRDWFVRLVRGEEQ